MCWVAAIPVAMAAIQTVTSSAQANQAAASQNDQSRRQALEMVKKLNYDDADAKLTAMDNLDTARQDLTVQSIQQVKTMGTVRAAIGEGNLEGNSMDRIKRVTEGDYIRSANSVTDQYNRDYAQIFAQRIGARDNTVNQIRAMQASEAKVKGPLEQIVDPLGLGIGKLFKYTDVIGKKVYAGKVKNAIDKDNAKVNN